MSQSVSKAVMLLAAYTRELGGRVNHRTDREKQLLTLTFTRLQEI